jgi:hypothetical protein
MGFWSRIFFFSVSRCSAQKSKPLAIAGARMVPSGEPIKIRGTGYPILPTPAFQAWKPPPQKIWVARLQPMSTAHAGRNNGRKIATKTSRRSRFRAGLLHKSGSMSASLRKRPNFCAAAKWRDGPQADIPVSIEHLVGAHHQRHREFNT